MTKRITIDNIAFKAAHYLTDFFGRVNYNSCIAKPEWFKGFYIYEIHNYNPAALVIKKLNHNDPAAIQRLLLFTKPIQELESKCTELEVTNCDLFSWDAYKENQIPSLSDMISADNTNPLMADAYTYINAMLSEDDYCKLSSRISDKGRALADGIDLLHIIRSGKPFIIRNTGKNHSIVIMSEDERNRREIIDSNDIIISAIKRNLMISLDRLTFELASNVAIIDKVHKSSDIKHGDEY
jgi:hypothetical protein